MYDFAGIDLTGDKEHRNQTVILCPNECCSSQILTVGTASLTRSHFQLPPVAASTAEPQDTSNGAQSLDSYWWRVADVLDFHNIGLSKPHNDVKYLLCADCELCPLGYQHVHSSECFLAADRIAYKS